MEPDLAVRAPAPDAEWDVAAADAARARGEEWDKVKVKDKGKDEDRARAPVRVAARDVVRDAARAGPVANGKEAGRCRDLMAPDRKDTVR